MGVPPPPAGLGCTGPGFFWPERAFLHLATLEQRGKRVCVCVCLRACVGVCLPVCVCVWVYVFVCLCVLTTMMIILMVMMLMVVMIVCVRSWRVWCA